MCEKSEPIVYNIDQWIPENKQYFLPPVCNKMMHKKGQLKIFCVGGPNRRKDYHIEDGEEVIYMHKGDMCLKVVEHGKHKDVIIKEGEIFLLPARVAHSPQRIQNTVGLVLERRRDLSELDGVRYYVEEDGEPTMESLFEEWFYIEDLGTQLVPVIEKFFASEQYKTGRPLPGTIPENPPIVLDDDVTLEAPFSLPAWVNRHRTDLDTKGCVQMFAPTYQFDIKVYGKGTNTEQCGAYEIFIWQLEGTSTVSVEGKDYNLKTNDTMLVLQGQRYTANRPDGSVALICHQDAERKQAVSYF